MASHLWRKLLRCQHLHRRRCRHRQRLRRWMKQNQPLHLLPTLPTQQPSAGLADLAQTALVGAARNMGVPALLRATPARERRLVHSHRHRQLRVSRRRQVPEQSPPLLPSRLALQLYEPQVLVPRCCVDHAHRAGDRFPSATRQDACTVGRAPQGRARPHIVALGKRQRQAHGPPRCSAARSAMSPPRGKREHGLLASAVTPLATADIAQKPAKQAKRAVCWPGREPAEPKRGLQLSTSYSEPTSKQQEHRPRQIRSSAASTTLAVATKRTMKQAFLQIDC